MYLFFLINYLIIPKLIFTDLNIKVGETLESLNNQNVAIDLDDLNDKIDQMSDKDKLKLYLWSNSIKFPCYYK